MRKLIKRILNNVLGIEIKRVFKDKHLKRSDVANPLYVEFAGAPGVGKSTLFGHLLAKKSNYVKLGQFVRLYNHGVSTEPFDNMSVYQKIANLTTDEVLKATFSDLDKMYVIASFYSLITNDALISKYNSQNTIVSDEGILHTLTFNMMQLLNEQEIKSLFKHKAIIYCYTSPEQIAKQLIDRQNRSNVVLPKQKHKQYGDLCEDAILQMLDKEKLIDYLQKIGIPVMRVNTAREIKVNVEEIEIFIEKLQF